jgi:hypothetical protein
MLASTTTDVSALLDAVSKLLWPALIAGIVVLFRAELAERIRTMRGFKGPGFEASFAEQADAVMRDSSVIAADGRADESQTALDLAARDPRRAIQEGWDSLRSATKDAVKKVGSEPVSSNEARVKLLADKGLLDPAAASLVRGLRALVVAARDPKQVVTASSAAAFVAAETNLERALKKAVEGRFGG